MRFSPGSFTTDTVGDSTQGGLVQETPNNHEGDSRGQAGTGANGTDSTDDEQESSHDETSTNDQRSSSQAIDERPRAHVSNKLNGIGDLTDSERIVDTSETEVVSVDCQLESPGS